MAKLIQTLIPLLSSIALLLALANTAQSQESLSFTYDFYGDQPPSLNLLNDAHYPSDSTYLRLTDAQPYSIGRVGHRIMMQFKRAGAQADFETTVKFIITRNNDDPADGLTFFLYPAIGTTLPPDASGSNLGIFSESENLNNAFAVEFDTYVNSAWDPTDRHVGIDIGSKTSSNTTEIGDALVGQEVTARINYVSATNLISVHVTAGSETFEVSYAYDLANLLPEYVIVGLSASTGGNVAIHDIISWYFTSTLVETGANSAKEGADIRQVI